MNGLLLHNKMRIERIFVAVAADRAHVVVRGFVHVANLAVVVYAVTPARGLRLHVHGVMACNTEDLRKRCPFPAVAYRALELHAGVRGVGNGLTNSAHMAVRTRRETELAGELPLAVRRIHQGPMTGHAAGGIVREFSLMDASVTWRWMAPVAAVRRGLFSSRNPVSM